ncbi:MAG: hypothetical protein WCG61_01435 [Chlorobium sp.]
MVIELPQVKLIPLRNEVDRFGFSHVLAGKYGIKKTPQSFSGFMHGWIWRKDMKLEDLGYYFTPRDMPVVVATAVQKEVMIRSGFKNVLAGGLPFAYINQSGIKRKPESLLVMPPHSMNHCGYSGIDVQFLDFLERIKNEFSEVCFCLHADDANDKILCRDLTTRNFSVVVGAKAEDANSLPRMRSIFDSYDYVATTTMGSHILYAAFSGCRVSVLKNWYSFLPESAFDKQQRSIPEFVERCLNDINNTQKLNKQFPWLFVDHPKRAVQMLDWAKNEIGADNLLDKDSMMSILGWTLKARINALMRIAYRRSMGILKNRSPLSLTQAN